VGPRRKTLVLHEMSSVEFSKVGAEVRLALLPTGSCEQHGPNLTLGVDTARCFEFSKLLCERLYPRAVVCPPVPYGVSYHHMGFAGTMTVKPETLVAMIMDVAWSIRERGITRLLVVNGHGGNRPSLGVAIVRAKHELGVDAAWVGCMSDMGWDVIEKRARSDVHGHACEAEVSQAMYLAPEHVRVDALEAGRIKKVPLGPKDWWGVVPWSYDEITENGALGDATAATREFGEELTTTVLERTVAFVRSYFFEEE